MSAAPTRFVLSPARADGARAGQLARSTTAPLGQQLRDGTAPLGDVFAWLSALYFRGKLTYARHFATAPAGVLIMAPGLGLVAPDTLTSPALLAQLSRVEVESAAFLGPLRCDAELLAADDEPDTRVVLLGSIATGKYVDTLLAVFGERLLFPADFVGRGDMSRGGLLLRAARGADELAYVPVAGAQRRGGRAPRLPPLRR